jgi:3',5'-cyclic AMP phosphodiesterase CpdA
LKWLGLVIVALAGACSGSPTQPSGGGGGGAGGGGNPNTGPATVLAAGDVAWCDDLTAARATSRLLDQRPGAVLALGDLAYFTGTREQYRDCYDPTWGRHRNRTHPVPGNHDYMTPGAGPYYEYFGEAAGGSGDGYYAFNEGSWRLIALNSNIDMGRGSPQFLWLQRELQNQPRCTLAFWHHPRFTSGPNGDNPQTGPIWELLYGAGVDVVLAGHDHVYERYLPMNPDGQLDRGRGIRQFISGGGGAPLYRFASVKPNSAARYEGYGVLKLVLGEGRYEWEFLPVTAGFSDTGFDMCH